MLMKDCLRCIPKDIMRRGIRIVAILIGVGGRRISRRMARYMVMRCSLSVEVFIC